MYLLYEIRALIGINKLMHCVKNALDFFVILADKADIEADTPDIAVNDITECPCFIGSLDNCMILIIGICKAKPGS